MAAKDLIAKNKTLSKWFGRTDFTAPATWHIGLLDASETEFSGDGYARVAVTNNTTNFVLDTLTGQTTLMLDITYPAATADWDAAYKVALFDADEGGDRYFKTNLSAPLSILSGIEFTFFAGDIVFIEL